MKTTKTVKKPKTTCVNCGRNMTPLTKSLKPVGKGYKSNRGPVYYCGIC